ncbi:MAG: hypothetical protein N2Z58_05730 [Fervidobacterium sp.]|nr:hypothetical protein [Fervidobacterium sp.]
MSYHNFGEYDSESGVLWKNSTKILPSISCREEYLLDLLKKSQ